MKYLKLSFKNAGFFENKNQNVSISVNQISNMLHVLMGERPCATYRKTIFKPVEEIREIAKNSYIKIDSQMFSQFGKTIFHEKKYYNREFLRTNKNSWDSYRDKGKCYMSWEMLNIYLGDELFNDFLNYIKTIIINIEDKTLLETLREATEICSNYDNVISIQSKINAYEIKKNEIKKENKIRASNGEEIITIDKVSFVSLIKDLKNDNRPFEILCRKFINNGKTPVIKLLFGWSSSTAINYGENLYITLTNINGIEPNLRKINGSIIVPLEEKFVNKIKNSKGYAKLLDSGFVWIEDLCSEYELGLSELDEYIPINELENYENNN